VLDDGKQPEAVEAIKQRIEGLRSEARQVGIVLEVWVDEISKTNLD
jgi:hypothetical protein